jgi:signal transduction histidine kinase/ActR/RegA family two-component response regulator
VGPRTHLLRAGGPTAAALRLGPAGALAFAGVLCGALAFAETAPAPAPPQLPSEIVYGGDDAFPPYEFRDEHGQPAGFNVDLIRAIAGRQGMRVKVELMPWARVRGALRDGRIDVAAMYRSPQRAREVDFAIPHELIYQEMFVRAGQPALRSLADLAGKRILVETDTLSVDQLADLGYGAQLVRMASEPEALRRLADGFGDVAIVTQTAGRPFLYRSALAGRIAPTGPPILLSEYAFVTNRGRAVLLAAINDGLVAVKGSGEYERLYTRWVRPAGAGRLLRIAAWFLGACVLLILSTVVWNASLRRQVARQTDALRREFAAKEQAQAALAESELALRRAQKMEAIGRLAGGVAHDFNNILTVISACGSLLRLDLERSGAATGLVDDILKAAERAARLTRQLLAFSRSAPPETARLDLGEIVRDMLTMIRRLVGEDVVVEAFTPEARLVVEAETSQIEQILLNLAANARDAMPSGGRLVIRVEPRTLAEGNALALPPGDYAAVTVADDGTGMDQATLGRMFEPLFTTKEAGKGTGIGLSAVVDNVAKLRGKVTVESARGRGTSFTFTLPACNAAPGPVHDTAAAGRAQAPRAGRQTILLVEDDEALRRTARTALERAGHRVVTACDGQDALEVAARDDAFSLLVTDVVMPRLGGAQCAAALRERRGGRPLPVLYVSGYLHESEALGLEAPHTAILAKPYGIADLVDAVERLASAAADQPAGT